MNKRILILTDIRKILIPEGIEIKEHNEYLKYNQLWSAYDEIFISKGYETDIIVLSLLLERIHKSFFYEILDFFYQKVIRRIFKSKKETFLKIVYNILIIKKVKNEKIDYIIKEFPVELTNRTVKKLNKCNCSVGAWFGIFPEQIPFKMLKEREHYNHVFLPGDYRDEFYKLGYNARNLNVIGSYFNSNFFYKDYEEKYCSDICFIGGISKIHFERIKILEFLAKNYANFSFWGYGTESLEGDSPLWNCYKGEATIEMMRKIYSSSKIALNLTLDNYDRVKWGVNMRAFEIPACEGAVQLAANVKNFKDFFIEDREILLFSNIDEMKKKIDYLLKEEEIRRNVVIEAKIKARMFDHKHAITNIIDIFEKGSSNE